jgi:hypothetical protein
MRRWRGASTGLHDRLEGVVDRLDLADEVARQVDHVRAQVAERARPARVELAYRDA